MEPKISASFIRTKKTNLFDMCCFAREACLKVFQKFLDDGAGLKLAALNATKCRKN